MSRAIEKIGGKVEDRDALIDAVLKTDLPDSPLGQPVRLDAADGTPVAEMVLDEVRRLELERAVVLDEVWAELALRQVPTLDGLARSTSGPWPQIFDGHRSALVALTREVRGVAATNLDVLERGHATTRDALRALSVDRVNVDLVEEATS